MHVWFRWVHGYCSCLNLQVLDTTIWSNNLLCYISGAKQGGNHFVGKVSSCEDGQLATYFANEIYHIAGLDYDSVVERPNILLIGVDDLRPERKSFGADYIYSPSIEQTTESGRVWRKS